MTLRQSANESVHAETVRDNWAQICDFTDSLHPKGQEASLLLGGHHARPLALMQLPRVRLLCQFALCACIAGWHVVDLAWINSL